MLCDAVENIAKHVAWEGQAVYELIEESDSIYIHGFTSKNLFKVLFWYLQIIPYNDWDFWKRKFALVNANKVWRIKIPNEFGGVKDYRKVLRKLGEYNDVGPKFYRTDLERGQITPKNFDFQKYIRESAIHSNRVTKKWGWNRKDWSQEKSTEFYIFYKMLNFKYAQAILREHIIEEINHLLDRLLIKCKIVVSGLPSSKEIVQIRDDMIEGEISFSKAINKVEI